MSATQAAPLRPIHCGSCGAAVPLVDAPAQSCPFCRAAVTTPPDYLQAASLQRASAQARKAVEPKWASLARGASPAWRWGGGIWMALAPPIATAVGLSRDPALATASVFALFTLPSVFPGGVTYVWGITADASRASVERNLVAVRPKQEGAPPCCRECGAPLSVEENALSCTCLYCGTDSLITNIPMGALSRSRDKAVRSLGEATAAVRRRTWGVRVALVVLAVALTGLSVALHLAHAALR